MKEGGRYAVGLALGTLLGTATHLDKEGKLTPEDAVKFVRMSADMMRLFMVHLYREDHIGEGFDDSLEKLDITDHQPEYWGKNVDDGGYWCRGRLIECADLMRMRHLPPGECIRMSIDIINALKDDSCPMDHFEEGAFRHLKDAEHATDFMDRIQEPGFKFKPSDDD